MVLDIGRMVVKTAGRDAGCKAVIIDVLDDNYVLIDGETRRRKCNMAHLEPLAENIEIGKNASHNDVATAFKKIGIELKEKIKKEITQSKNSNELKEEKAKKKKALKKENKE